MRILHVDSSVNDFDNSMTRQVSQHLVDTIMDKQEECEVFYLDLAEEEIPFISREYQEAMFAEDGERTPEQEEILAEFDIDSVVNADVYVFGVPGYCFNVPASFKNWVEHWFRFGATISSEWEGLLKNKKMYIASAWGGNYAGKEVEASFQSVIRSFFQLLGITDITFFHVYIDDDSGENNLELIKERIAREV